MKKSIFYSVVFVSIYSLCYSTVACSQKRSVHFEQGTWKEIRQKARAEKKIIFLVAYYEWDSNYEKLKKNVFTNDTVADFYNEHFICCEINFDKAEVPLFDVKYNVLGGLTYLFLDYQETVLHRDYHSKSVPEFMTLGETALNPETRFEAWETKYRKGDREPAFIRQYLKMLRPYGNEAQEIADWYFTTQKNEDLLTKENFEMIKEYLRNGDSPAFQYMVAQRAKFREMFGADEVDKKIFDVYNWMIVTSHSFIRPCGEFKVDEKAFNHAKEEIKKSKFERADELLLYADIWYYDEKRDGKKYAEAAEPYVNKYKINDYNYLNYTAWYFYAHDEITDASLLNQALAWAKKSVEGHPCVAAYDAYASLLYKLNKKNEAKKAIETAIEMRKKEGEDISSSKYLLDKIQAMK